MSSEVVVGSGGRFVVSLPTAVRRRVGHPDHSAEIGRAQPSFLVVVMAVKLPTLLLENEESFGNDRKKLQMRLKMFSVVEKKDDHCKHDSLNIRPNG